MLNVPSEIQAVIKNDATLKNFRVHFPNGERADLTNENIVFESVSFTESVCSEDTLRFGLAEASTIEFEAVGIQNIFGAKIECFMEFKVPSNLVETYGEWYSIPYGTFIVEKCQRDQQDIAHRRVVAYSLIKYDLSNTTFLQKRVLPVPNVLIPNASMHAYLSGDVSKFNKDNNETLSKSRISILDGSLFDENGNEYYFFTQSEEIKCSRYMRMSGIEFYRYAGYEFLFEETGTKTNEEVGLEIVNFVNGLDLDLTYDSQGKKIFSNNEEALRFNCGIFFHPVEQEEDSESDKNATIKYRQHEVIANKFMPIYYEEAPKIGLTAYTRFFSCLLGSDEAFTVQLRSGPSLKGDVQISGFKANASFKGYTFKGYPTMVAPGFIKINSTLMVNNSFLYRKTDSSKNYYAKMYAYSNAFSMRDMANGDAELNASFVHSNRDGSLSMGKLDSSNPYQVSLSDIEGSAWWDEYDYVNRIGSIKYTFFNPNTGQTEDGLYTFDHNAKSVYDLSGNKFLESIDFRVVKTKKYGSDDDYSPIDFRWYLYIGTDTDRKNHVFTYRGGQWEDCGLYKNVTILVEYVLEKMFVPYVNLINFTPVEMSLRGMPYLEAGDAFTLTAQDGTILNSYILNHTFDGIQHIEQNIESVSGEVIE